jgi:hypothetical protein
MYALHSLAQHWVENEALIERAAKEEIEQSGPKWTPKTDEEYSVFFAERSVARMMHDDIMIPMHRYSCIVMLFTTVERELKRLVDNLETERGQQKLKLNDIGGAFLNKVAKYIEVFYDLRLANCPHYAALHDLQKIRNCIIHRLGEVGESDDDKYLVELQTKRAGFFAHTPNGIWIKPECIRKFFVEIWSFFSWVFGELKWKINSCFQVDKLERTFKDLK